MNRYGTFCECVNLVLGLVLMRHLYKLYFLDFAKYCKKFCIYLICNSVASWQMFIIVSYVL
jgi:hypothetical protein